MLLLQDSVEPPEPPVIGEDDNVQLRLVEFVATSRLTDPVKPFTDATVIVEVPATPVFAFTMRGLAVTVKSWT